MSLFKKEKKEMTLQEVEQEFNKAQFELGSLTYLADLKTHELNLYNDQINKVFEKMRKLAHKGNLLRGKIQTEIEETIKAGEKVESPLN